MMPVYCSCPRCNMKKPDDPYDEYEDLEGVHT